MTNTPAEPGEIPDPNLGGPAPSDLPADDQLAGDVAPISTDFPEDGDNPQETA